MNEQQIALVQQTFYDHVLPISEAAAEIFYNKLFELDPEVRPLFKTDMKSQGQKLMQMLAAAVNGLNHLESIIPAAQALGRRHVNYGVVDAHYDTVGEALVWTLGQGMGDAFTPEVKEAWVATYTILAKVMIDAANNTSHL